MSDGLYNKREHAISTLKHPLNRDFLIKVIASLNPGGIYGWPEIGEFFTREELVKILEEIKKEESR